MTNDTKSALNDVKSIIISDENYFYGQVKPKVLLSEGEKTSILKQFPTPDFVSTDNSVHISEHEPGTSVNKMLVLIDSTITKMAANKKPYMELVLSNSKGSFKAKLWSDVDSIADQVSFFENNKAAYLSGKVEEYPKASGNKTLTIQRYSPVEDGVNLLSLLKVTDQSFESMTLELVSYLNELREPHKSIALAGLKNVWRDFSVAPGAKWHHHAYVGGLLKHTLGLVRLGRYIGNPSKKPAQSMFELLDVVKREHKKEMANKIVSDPNPQFSKLIWANSIDHIHELIFNFSAMAKTQDFDLDLLTASAVWHDTGKYLEYTHLGDSSKKFDLLFPYAKDLKEVPTKYNQNVGGFSMDQLGVMVGHMPMGVLLFQRIIEKEDIEIELETLYQYMHNILSHHGKLEWGSSVTPQTPTAVVLHLVDFLDSRFENYDANNK